MTDALLEKYMRHVMQCEGTDFVGRINDRSSGSDVVFSEAEQMALRAASVCVSANPWAHNPADVLAALGAPGMDPHRIAELRAMYEAPLRARLAEQPDGLTPPTDYANPDWPNAGKVHDWKNHISEAVQFLWPTFTVEQQAAIAASADEQADRENWG